MKELDLRPEDLGELDRRRKDFFGVLREVYGHENEFELHDFSLDENDK